MVRHGHPSGTPPAAWRSATGAVEELRTAVRDSTRLARILNVLSEPAPLERVLDRALLALSELFAADVVALLDAPGGGRLAVRCAIGLPEDPSLPPFSGEPGSRSAEAAAAGAPVPVPIGAQARLDAPLRHLGVETAVYLPALDGQEVLGVLVVARCQALPFAAADVDLLFAMAHRLGLTLERARDAEAQRRHEARLVEARKAESLGRMAGAIAHRFNNLLGAASTFLELASADLPPGEQLRSDLANALQAVREAAQVSGLMLAYLGHGRQDHEPLELSAVCRAALAAVRPSLPRTVALRAELCAERLVVRGSASGLQGLISSLVVNAWEATAAAGGEIVVALRPASAGEPAGGRVLPPGWTPGAAAHACLEVRDTGCGMDAAVLQNAFDPFFSTKFTGRGLGLPVALGTVRAHAGAIAVESAPGLGSRFRVFLPLFEGAAVPSAPPEAEPW